MSKHSLSQKIYASRIIILNGVVDNQSSAEIIFQMLSMEKENSKEDIYLYINSPGGSIVDGLAIYDTMRFIKPDVATVCIGQASSMGAFLLAAGTKGKRSALPHSTILIHQPLTGGNSGGYQQQTDFEILASRLLKTRNTLEHILSENTGQTLERIHKDSERDYYMTASEALEYGIIDTILKPSDE